jgi:hypothetical protein
MAESIKEASWLEWIERAMGDTEADSVPPRSRFSCYVDNPPSHLVPERYRNGLRSARFAPESLSLHPQCILTRCGPVPAGVADSSLAFSTFALDADIAWVPDPRGRSLRPFWLTAQQGRFVEGLKSQELSVRDLPVSAIPAFAAAGILASQEKLAEEQTTWEEKCKRIRAQFAEKFYAPVGGLIHPFHLAALRRYYRFLVRTGSVSLGDDQSPRRYAAHNEEVARFFHQQLTPVVSAIAGEPVKPSYVYFASYQAGAILEKHSDREQCEFSITFCVDYAPEPELATAWPIFLHTKQGRVTVYQGIGDALFYHGCLVPHERYALPRGHTSTSIFFHYVRESFAGKLD